LSYCGISARKDELLDSARTGFITNAVFGGQDEHLPDSASGKEQRKIKSWSSSPWLGALSWLLPLCSLRLTFDLMPVRLWKLARRSLPYGERTLVMGVLNVTPDSFSDGGEFFSLDRAVAHAEQMIAEGAASMP